MLLQILSFSCLLTALGNLKQKGYGLILPGYLDYQIVIWMDGHMDKHKCYSHEPSRICTVQFLVVGRLQHDIADCIDIKHQ